jgi:hypothetical protein
LKNEKISLLLREEPSQAEAPSASSEPEPPGDLELGGRVVFSAGTMWLRVLEEFCV